MSIQYSAFHNIGSSILPPNQTMSPGQYLCSANGRYRLELQGDGNLVMKDNETLVWVADTNQPHSLTLANKRLVGLPKFVVSNSGFLYDPARKRTWIAESTHTTDKLVWYNSFLAVQDDGNIIIYDDRTGDLCWARFGFEPGRHRKKINPSLWALLKNMEVRLEPTLEPRRLTLLMRIICVV